MDGLPDDKLLDLFTGTLKDNIQHEVRLFESTSLEEAFMVARKVEIKNVVMAIRRTTPNTSKESNVPSANTLNNWRKEEKKVYALIVTTSIVRDIIVVRRSCST